MRCKTGITHDGALCQSVRARVWALGRRWRGGRTEILTQYRGRCSIRHDNDQDFVAFQSEVLRDNIETFLVFARKVGEHSTRLADEAKRRVGSLGEGRQAA